MNKLQHMTQVGELGGDIPLTTSAAINRYLSIDISLWVFLLWGFLFLFGHHRAREGKGVVGKGRPGNAREV